jgi:DNA modification methylase
VVAAAKSRKEAFKALKRDEETKRNAELGRSVGATFTASMHTLRQGDCLEVMKELANESFDVILTDPPYGIDAQDFGDSDGKAGAHFYADDYGTWKKLMIEFTIQSMRLAKPQAHAYIFCDIDNFQELKRLMQMAEWKVFRTPFIWVNPTAMRTPWPDQGPQRKWQICLYAVKGSRTVTRIYSDVITYPSDINLGHQAQKPVALYQDLLRRSIRPGDTVLDPFCGTGTIFPAAHELKCRATGIELDAAACGIAAKRLEALK